MNQPIPSFPRKTERPPRKSGWSWLKRAAGLLIFVLVAAILADFVSVGVSHATGIPVFDAASVTQMIQQGIQMAQQLEAAFQQIDILKNQVASLTGHYGIGVVGSAVNPWGNSSWQQIINMVNSGVNPGDGAAVQAYQAAQTRYQQSNPALAADLLPQNQRMSASYSGTYQEAIAGMGMGEVSFNSAQGYMNDLQTYKSRIDQTDNVKAAIDLNTAVSIKHAQISAEILRMNAMQLHSQANTQNNQTNGQAAEAEFFSESQ